MRLKPTNILCAIACVAVAPASAAAQTATAGPPSEARGVQELEEVIVTAERRTSDVQKTAASVSVRSGEDLAAQGRYSVRQILEDVPGVSAVDNSSLNVGGSDVQGNNITIRGITPATNTGGGLSPAGISPTPGVAVYVDGVYEGLGGSYDLEHVEVLRGPQGTLYGRSATSGVLAFHTRNPSLDGFEGNVGVEVGNYDLRHYTGAVNVPLSHGLALRLSANYHDQGEAYYGQDSKGGLTERTKARAKLLWRPNDRFSVLAGFAYEKDDSVSGGATTTAAPPTLAQTTVISPFTPTHKDQRQYWAEINWDAGPVKLTYLPAFRSWKQNDDVLVDPSFLSSGLALKQKFLTPKDDFNTHELRVASQDDAALKWQAGLYYYDNKLRNTNHNALVNADGSEHAVITDTQDKRDTKSLGYFAEGTYALTDSVRATVGARYDDTEVVVSEYFFNNPYAACGTYLAPPIPCSGVAQSPLPLPAGTQLNDFKVKFHNFNYKARLEYDLTPKNMVFGMISTGFRPGDALISNGAALVVDAEKLTSFEVGSKNRFLDDSLQVNLGVYYYKYDGFATSYRPNTANPQDFADFTANDISLTVPARNLGGEVEVLYQTTAHDRIGFNYNYVQSRWVNKPAGFALAQPETKRALTPHTITANYEHVFDLPGGSTLSARIDGKFESSHLTANLHADWLAMGYDRYVRVDARTIGNLSATWTSDGGRYLVNAYVHNFTDAKYTNYRVGINSQSIGVTWNDPRTFGVMLSANF